MGIQELVVILAIVLVLFRSKRLPELARGLGEAVRLFQHALDQPTPDPPKPTHPQSLPKNNAPSQWPASTLGTREQPRRATNHPRPSSHLMG